MVFNNKQNSTWDQIFVQGKSVYYKIAPVSRSVLDGSHYSFTLDDDHRWNLGPGTSQQAIMIEWTRREIKGRYPSYPTFCATA